MPLNPANKAPLFVGGSGVRTPFGLHLPPGARVAAYVHASGWDATLDESIDASKLVQTVNAGLAKCRANRGDVVMVLPGHAETINAADKWSNLVAGTNIVCIGEGTDRPKFTWSAATATVLLDVANCHIYGGKFELAGDPTSTTALTVAAGITVSADGCGLHGCLYDFGIDADQIVTLGVVVTSDDCVIEGIRAFGATAAECTTFLRLTGADRLRLLDCIVIGATSSTTVGVVQFLTTASTQVEIVGLRCQNNKAASVHAATGMVGLTGMCSWGHFGVLDNSTLTGFVTEGSMQFFECRTANLAGEAAGLKTIVSV